jgi:uncharacterized protein DUF5996
MARLSTRTLRVRDVSFRVHYRLLDGDVVIEASTGVRAWRPDAAHLVWAGFNAAADALERWQAPYCGHRPRVGVMWGGFDLSATRYRGAAVTPPAGMQSWRRRTPLAAWDTAASRTLPEGSRP